MKVILCSILLSLSFATIKAQINADQVTDSARNTICPLKVLQIVKTCALAHDFPKGTQIAVGSYNKQKQYCTISVYTEVNGQINNIYGLIFYPATKELFQITDGRTSVAYDHKLDEEMAKYCW